MLLLVTVAIDGYCNFSIVCIKCGDSGPRGATVCTTNKQ